MKKHSFGFTLSEILIAMTVLGILGVVLAPILSKMMPNQNKVMIKRSYYVITNTVQSMLDDDTLYSPFGAVGSGNETTPIYADSLFSNKEAVNYNGNNFSGDTKFAGIFSEMIAAKSLGNEKIKPVFRRGPGSRVFIESNYPAYVTKDGIKYIFYTPEYADIVSLIIVDVNGNKGPNCYEGEYGNCPTRTKDFDQYTVGIFNDGRISISLNDVWIRTILDASGSFNAE